MPLCLWIALAVVAIIIVSSLVTYLKMRDHALTSAWHAQHTAIMLMNQQAQDQDSDDSE